MELKKVKNRNQETDGYLADLIDICCQFNVVHKVKN